MQPYITNQLLTPALTFALLPYTAAPQFTSVCPAPLNVFTVKVVVMGNVLLAHLVALEHFLLQLVDASLILAITIMEFLVKLNPAPLIAFRVTH